MGTITKVKTKSSKNNTTSKIAKSANKKKFILRYWMDERINYKAENEKYIIERNTKKMTNMGSLYGTNGFYIDITPKKTYKILSDGKGYDFKSLKNNYIYYEEYCDGMGQIEIETNYPDSIIPHKVKNGLIQSVIDKDGQEFIIYDQSDFQGELNHYDTPEFNSANLLVIDESIEQGEISNGRLVPIDYDSWCNETSITYYSDKWVLIVEFLYCFSLNLNSKDRDFLEAIEMITPSQITKLKIYKGVLTGIKKWYLSYDNYKSLARLKLLAQIIKDETDGLEESWINTFSAAIYTLHKSQDTKIRKLCNSILNIMREKVITKNVHLSDAKQIIGTSKKILNLEVAEFDFPITMKWDDAKKGCEKLGNGWRLPDPEELNLIYINKDKIGNLDGEYYWTSKEFQSGDDDVWFKDFNEGTVDFCKKKYLNSVRAIRNK